MKYSFNIISKLYSFSLLWFYGTIIIIIYALLNLCFPSADFSITGKNYKIGSDNSFKKGFAIPATITIQMPADTVVNYAKGNSKGELYLRNENDFIGDINNQILRDSTIKKDSIIYKWIADESFNSNNDKSESFDAEDNEISIFNKRVKKHAEILDVNIASSYVFDTTIHVKPNTVFRKLVLIIGSLISMFLYLTISFQFMKIIKQLNNGISFENKIYRRLNIIGVSIILIQILYFLLGYIFQFWYSRVSLLESTTKCLKDKFQIQFNPSLDLSFSMILIGLTIIVLSYIFKYGNTLEEENALTV
jgi:hypothetical protein